MPATETEVVGAFLRNEAFVLLAIAASPDDATQRAVAEKTGMTERAVHRIIGVLEKEGYLTLVREGRNNRYEVNTAANLPHPMEKGLTVGHLLKLMRKKEK